MHAGSTIENHNRRVEGGFCFFASIVGVEEHGFFAVNIQLAMQH